MNMLRGKSEKITQESTNPQLSSNGGDYTFWTTTYFFTERDQIEVYFTSADFYYCPRCGNFGKCSCYIQDPEWFNLFDHVWSIDCDLTNSLENKSLWRLIDDGTKNEEDIRYWVPSLLEVNPMDLLVPLGKCHICGKKH